MQRDIGEKIDFLMKVTATSNAQLARALNFDASYISRIRAGKRGLPPELPFIEPASAFFARNVREGYQAEALASELELPDEWPEDGSKASRLIAEWLDGVIDAKGQNATGASSGTARMSVDAQTSLALEQDGAAQLFFGNEGRREAALAFLASVAGAGEPCEVLLQSDENTAWMYGDPTFAAEWTELMIRLAGIGCTFTVVHTVSRGGNEMWEGLRAWLPLYLTGAIRPYYYPRMRDGVRMRSLFVVRNRCALVSNSVQGMKGDELCVLFDNSSAAKALAQEFDAYLELCRPLAQVERLVPQGGLESAIAAYRDSDDVVVAEIGNAIVCARPGHDALLVSKDERIVYRVTESRLVDAIAGFAERV